MRPGILRLLTLSAATASRASIHQHKSAFSSLEPAQCRLIHTSTPFMMAEPEYAKVVAEEHVKAVPTAAEPTKAAAPSQEQQALPKLTPMEFRIYNPMAEHMDMFHENFRRSWNLMYGACNSGKRPLGMSIRQFLAVGSEFSHHLEVHHSIEEQHIFPVLAKKMPAFKKELELLTQHKQIHAGLEKFEAYIEDCKSDEKELRLQEMKTVMETFGTVLWQHLDDEVNQLKAENMRKYWTLEEMRRMPM
ncbi:hypothetical protein BJ546DRAFT_977373 [Cryomyces antarcticus]